MKNDIGSSEMTCMMVAIVTAQWFSSTADGFLDACGNAVWISMIGAGLLLLVVALFTQWLTPKDGMLAVCQQRKGVFLLFPIITAVLFTLVASTAMRDVLTMISTILLPRTTRWFVMLISLPVILLMGMMGISSVARPLRILTPMFLVLYVAIVMASIWRQVNVYNLFPILGPGVPALGRTAISGLTVAVWLPMMWIERKQLQKPYRLCIKFALVAMALCLMGYISYALLFPNGSMLDSSFSLHRLSAAGAFSHVFQRMHTLFVFVWFPIQLAAVGAALCYAVRSLHVVIPIKNPRWLVAALLLIILVTSYQESEQSPIWLLYLLQTNMQSLLLVPLLIPMLVGKIADAKQKKEASHA